MSHPLLLPVTPQLIIPNSTLPWLPPSIPSTGVSMDSIIQARLSRELQDYLQADPRRLEIVKCQALTLALMDPQEFRTGLLPYPMGVQIIGHPVQPMPSYHNYLHDNQHLPLDLQLLPRVPLHPVRPQSQCHRLNSRACLNNLGPALCLNLPVPAVSVVYNNWSRW